METTRLGRTGHNVISKERFGMSFGDAVIKKEGTKIYDFGYFSVNEFLNGEMPFKEWTEENFETLREDTKKIVDELIKQKENRDYLITQLIYTGKPQFLKQVMIDLME